MRLNKYDDKNNIPNILIERKSLKRAIVARYVLYPDQKKLFIVIFGGFTKRAAKKLKIRYIILTSHFSLLYFPSYGFLSSYPVLFYTHRCHRQCSSTHCWCKCYFILRFADTVVTAYPICTKLCQSHAHSCYLVCTDISSTCSVTMKECYKCSQKLVFHSYDTKMFVWQHMQAS